MNKEYFDAELSNIFYIAQVNEFPKSQILQLYNKIKKKFTLNRLTALTPISNKPETKYYSIPFLGDISVELSKFLRNSNITISFSSGKNLKSLLSHIKDPTPTHFRSGVYSIFCADCPSRYIGVTRRSFNVRFDEHLSQIINNLTSNNKKITSNFASHCLQFNHMYSRDFKLLHSSKNNHLDETLEKYYIYIDSEFRPLDLINEQLNFSNIDIFKLIFDQIPSLFENFENF